ncbi:MAG: family four-helix-bundle protein [Nevskia sp.]|nr:family four-helix-bundle protein [Nevskia sp.]
MLDHGFAQAVRLAAHVQRRVSQSHQRLGDRLHRDLDDILKAKAATLPPQVRTVVQRQHDGAVRNHDLIRDLRNSYKAKKEAVAS